MGAKPLSAIVRQRVSYGSTCDEPSGMLSIWSSFDCGLASLGKVFSLCANSVLIHARTPSTLDLGT
jgi:hypothetical protein